jgi:hypothetical protein
MKRKTALIISLSLVVLLFLTALAIAKQPIRLFVDGSEIYPDVPPQIINNRTMVPLRAVAEALGCDVQWNNGSINISTISSTTIEIGGPEDFKRVINEALGKMDNNTLMHVNQYIKRIIFEDPPSVVPPQASASMDVFYGCHINGAYFNKLKTTSYSQDDIILYYLGVLAHEATHSSLCHARIETIYTTSDQEAICDIAALRAVERANGTKNRIVYQTFKNAIEQKLKL